MIGAVLIAVALIAGADPRRVAMLGVALYLPVVLLVLFAIAFWSSRGSGTSRSALLCEGIAAELRSGAPLRDAIEGAVTSVGARSPVPLRWGSLTETAEFAAAEFEDIGPELEMTIRAAAQTGGASADLFDEIGSVAIARSEIAHEVRVASAPARATAGIFVSVPIIYLFLRARSGGLARLLDTPEQRLVGLVGLVLLVGGVGLAAVTLWKAR